MRFVLAVITLISCLLLTSCFDVREELWVHADGSGRLELKYTVPTQAFELAGGEAALGDQMGELFDSEPKLTLESLEVVPMGRDSVISVAISTSSMLSLLELQENETFQAMPDSATGFLGSFDVGIKRLGVDFDRMIDLKRSLGLAALAISRDQREKRTLQYIVHLPTAAKRHNADRTENDGRTLIWNYTLGDALTSPIHTEFHAPIPVPWWVIALVLILAGLLIARVLRRWRKRRLQQLATA